MICKHCGEILECRACKCEQGSDPTPQSVAPPEIRSTDGLGALSRVKLSLALVDHLRDEMGNAAAGLIPVVDRAEEYVVIVMTKDAYERRSWPIAPNVGDQR